MTTKHRTRRMFKSKIHRATVTQADLDYEGSLTIDESLMELADILPGEEVHVWNVTRGSRTATYAITGQRDSGVICANGAIAHHVRPGDLVIIATFTDMTTEDAMEAVPAVVFVDSENRPSGVFAIEVAGPARRSAGN